jgi:transposase
MAGFPGLFDVDERLKRLSDLGDQLLAFAGAVDFEIFRADLDRALGYSDGAQGGRPPFDAVTMFKILVIQAANDLSDERAEFLINDRLSFMRFLGLGLSDRVPDARTIWLFREKLTRAGAIKALFDRFDASLRASGYIAMSGQIVDASLIAAPKQRNTQAEKDDIKAGRIPGEWAKKPAKLAHKDRDARWTVKLTKAKVLEDGSKPAVDLAIPAFDYKNHVSIDKEFGLIRTWLATDAAAYDGAIARRAARQDQHRERGLGRHRLSLAGQRRLHGQERLRLQGPPQKAQGPSDARRHPPRQCVEIESALPRRARLRRPEGSDGLVHPHHRHRQGDDENRHGQHRLQHQADVVPEKDHARIRANGGAQEHKRPLDGQRSAKTPRSRRPSHARRHQTTPAHFNKRVDRTVQLADAALVVDDSEPRPRSPPSSRSVATARPRRSSGRDRSRRSATAPPIASASGAASDFRNDGRAARLARAR